MVPRGVFCNQSQETKHHPSVSPEPLAAAPGQAVQRRASSSSTTAGEPTKLVAASSERAPASLEPPVCPSRPDTQTPTCISGTYPLDTATWKRHHLSEGVSLGGEQRQEPALRRQKHVEAGGEGMLKRRLREEAAVRDLGAATKGQDGARLGGSAGREGRCSGAGTGMLSSPTRSRILSHKGPNSAVGSADFCRKSLPLPVTDSSFRSLSDVTVRKFHRLQHQLRWLQTQQEFAAAPSSLPLRAPFIPQS